MTKRLRCRWCGTRLERPPPPSSASDGASAQLRKPPFVYDANLHSHSLPHVSEHAPTGPPKYRRRAKYRALLWLSCGCGVSLPASTFEIHSVRVCLNSPLTPAYILWRTALLAPPRSNSLHKDYIATPTIPGNPRWPSQWHPQVSAPEK